MIALDTSAVIRMTIRARSVGHEEAMLERKGPEWTLSFKGATYGADEENVPAPAEPAQASPTGGTTGLTTGLTTGFTTGFTTGVTTGSNQYTTPAFTESPTAGERGTTYTYFCRIHPYMRGSLRVK